MFIDPKWDIGILKNSVVIVTAIFLIQDFLRRYLIIESKLIKLIFIDIVAYTGQFLILGYFISIDNFNLNSVFISIIISFGISAILAVSFLSFSAVRYKYIKLIFLKNWNFSKWLVYSSILQWGGGNYFIVATGAILGNAAVGGIRSIQNIMGVFHIVIISLENILPITFSKLFRKKAMNQLIFTIKKYLVYGLVCISVLILISIPLKEIILELLFGIEYVKFSYLLAWFLVIYMFVYTGTLLKHFLRTIENTKVIFQSYIINFLFSLFTAYYLISNFELLGVVFGMITQQLIMNLIMIFSIYKSKSLFMLDLNKK